VHLLSYALYVVIHVFAAPYYLLHYGLQLCPAPLYYLKRCRHAVSKQTRIIFIRLRKHSRIIPGIRLFANFTIMYKYINILREELHDCIHFFTFITNLSNLQLVIIFYLCLTYIFLIISLINLKNCERNVFKIWKLPIEIIL